MLALRTSCSLLKNGSILRALSASSSRFANQTQQQQQDPPLIETREITKDRSQEVPVETSIRYLSSTAYKQTYAEEPVWVQYRRNFKGQRPPRKTRKTCIRAGVISTGNPCPICRDEYLVLHEQNVDLLKQFICSHTGSVLSYSKTGLCQKKHEQLIVAIKRAIDLGLITYDVPFRQYDYSEYYPELVK